MEAVLLASIGACSAATAIGLIDDSAAAPSWVVAERAARSCARSARSALEGLSETWLVRRLPRSESWYECASALGRCAEKEGLEISEPVACAALLVAAQVAGLLMSLLFATWLCVPMSVGGLALGVPAVAAHMRDARKKEMAEAMPAVFRTLAVAMGAGMTLVQAAEYAGAHVGGPVGEAFARLGLRLRCGAATEAALEALTDELPAPGVGLLAAALTISHRTGSPLRGLFQRSALLVERQGEFERLLSVKTAQVRLSVRVVCLLPAVMVAILATISPDFQKGLGTPAGIGCVCAAALLDTLAVAIIRRLVAGVLR